MGVFEVTFAPTAVRDLESIVRYIARDNPAAAERFGLELDERAQALSDPIIRESGGHLPGRPGVRKLVHGNYLILYRVLATQEKVRVLRFWHGAQDRDRLRKLS